MTFEEVKRIRENPYVNNNPKNWKEMQELIDYAVERQIPKKPLMGGNHEPEMQDIDVYICPYCSQVVAWGNKGEKPDKDRFEYCCDCGQAILWEGDDK